jgi:hypothetical protein
MSWPWRAPGEFVTECGHEFFGRYGILGVDPAFLPCEAARGRIINDNTFRCTIVRNGGSAEIE